MFEELDGFITAEILARGLDPGFVISALVTSGCPKPQVLADALHTVLTRYCLLVTGDIMLCVASQESAQHTPEDCVWALKGSSQPSLLRPMDGNWTYHGTMIQQETPDVEVLPYSPRRLQIVMDEEYFTRLEVQSITLV